MAEINDILGLGKITIALLDKFEKIGGFVFTPFQLKRIGRAQIQLIKEINESIDGDFKINITKDNVSIECHKDNSLLGQNISNIIVRELNKQENISRIVSKTIDILEQKKIEKEEVNIDNDWLNNYIECVKNISDDEMQNIWAKILADETENDGSYSISTLNILKNMSKQDALLFTKVAKCSFKWSNQYLLLNVEKCMDIYGFNLLDTMTLNDLGLLNDSGKSINYNSNRNLYIKDKLLYEHKSLNNKYYSISIMTLTRAGRELLKLIEEKRDFSDDEIKKIFGCKDNMEVVVYQMISEEKYHKIPLKIIN